MSVVLKLLTVAAGYVLQAVYLCYSAWGTHAIEVVLSRFSINLEASILFAAMDAGIYVSKLLFFTHSAYWPGPARGKFVLKNMYKWLRTESQ